MRSTKYDVQAKFLQASALVGTEFLDRLDYYANAWLPARDLVVAALEKRKQVDEQGRIILFEQFAPWKVRRALIHLSRSGSLIFLAGAPLRARECPWHPRGREAALRPLPG